MKTNHTKDERKPSEIFEGENSSLRKIFDEATEIVSRARKLKAKHGLSTKE